MKDKQARIEDAPECENIEWYHGYLPREEINRLLRKEGQFLVRSTEPKPGEGFVLVLTVRVKDKASHLLIYIDENKRFYLTKARKFNTIREMLLYYQNAGEPVSKSGAILQRAVLRQQWEIARNQLKVRDKIGSGAFGDVHEGELALSEGDVRKVAMKLHRGSGISKETIKELSAEARMLRTLHHPNVVKFYGVAFEKEPIIICMELADGGSLDNYLKKHRVSLDDKLSMCLDAARGLEYLHSQNVIHRDVAARNCLVVGRNVKISDFGLAKLSETGQGQLLNEKKLPIRWLAPETLKHRQYSTKSDVFAFGVFLWEVYTDAEKPYPKLNNEQVYFKVTDGFRLSKPSQMPEDVGKLMLYGCFRTEQLNRWTMVEISAVLEQIKDGENPFAELCGNTSQQNSQGSHKQQ